MSNRRSVPLIVCLVSLSQGPSAFATYNPVQGRWLQRDPVGYVDGVNLYEYAKSSPTVLVDPLGTESYRPETFSSCPSGSDYKPDKCRAAAQKGLSNCLKSEKAGGPGAPAKADCFETFAQHQAACARGKPGTHDEEVSAGSDLLDCVGRCLAAKDTAKNAMIAGIGGSLVLLGGSIPVDKAGAIPGAIAGSPKSSLMDRTLGGLADELRQGGGRPGRDASETITRNLKSIRGPIRGGIIGFLLTAGAKAAYDEVQCLSACSKNLRAY